MATTRTGKELAKRAEFFDDRLNLSGQVRVQLNKVFPDHWSFMLGEVALYNFIILLLTGTYLTLFFQDSLSSVVYHGSYVPMRGVTVSEAFASTLNISFDVRAGLLIRQIHHWAALLFLAAIVLHLSRVFFTGAFRKPREINWTIGVGLLTLGIVEGYAGYSLPGDLLSGEGLRIAYSILLAIPVVGTWAAYLLFGGPYPGTSIEGRLYVAHILLIPGILLALITAHLAMVWHQKHTQFPGPGKTNDNVVGERLFPGYAVNGGGFFFLVFGVLALLGGLAQINPIWLYGPYNTYEAGAGSQPDWYMGFLDGAVRLMPNWEFRGLGHTVSFNILVPGIILPGILFTGLALWPTIEAKLTGDHDYHNLAQRPREAPMRTGVGMMALTFYFVLLLASASDVFAAIFQFSLNVVLWVLRALLFIGPPVAYKVTKKICENLNAKDQAEAEHGYETGVIRLMPSGQFIEVHAPLPPRPDPHLVPVQDGHTEIAYGSAPAAIGGTDGAEAATNGSGGTLVTTASMAPGGASRRPSASAFRGVTGWLFKRDD